MNLPLGKNIFRLKLGGLVSLLGILRLFAQTDTSLSWNENPLEYVQKMASEASREQILVQDSIKFLTKQLKETETKYPNTTNERLKAQLKKDIPFLKFKINRLQASLKTKMKASKRYKDLLTLKPEEIRTILQAEYGQPKAAPPLPIASELIVSSQSDANPDQLPLPETSTSTKSGLVVSEPVRRLKKVKPNKSEKPKGAQSAKPKAKPSDGEVGATQHQKTVPLEHSPPNNRSEKVQPSNFTPNRSNKTSLSWLDTKYNALPCTLQANANGKNKAVQPELLYTYTPEEVKRHLKDLNYTQGFAFLGMEPGYTYLQLNIEIASDQAILYYGTLGKSNLLIRLINGKEVRLINTRYDSGKVDPVKKTTQLSGIYYLDKTIEKTLASSEIDTIRLHYVSGYEDYIIYNVDFFIRQLRCLNAVN